MKTLADLVVDFKAEHPMRKRVPSSMPRPSPIRLTYLQKVVRKPSLSGPVAGQKKLTEGRVLTLGASKSHGPNCPIPNS